MEEIISVASHCSQCEAQINPNQVFCSICGFPEQGSDSEKSKFHANRVMKKRKVDDANKRIKSARNGLFVVSALSFVGGLFYFFAYDDMGALVVSAILSLIYLGLGYWAQEKPLVALVLGLTVYITTIALSSIIDPSTLFKGIIIKMVIIYYLVKGVNSALELKKAD